MTGGGITGRPCEEYPYFVVEFTVYKQNTTADGVHHHDEYIYSIFYVDAYTGKVIPEPERAVTEIETVQSGALSPIEKKEEETLNPFKHIDKGLNLQLLYILPHLDNVYIADFDGDKRQEIMGEKIDTIVDRWRENRDKELDDQTLIYKDKNIVYQRSGLGSREYRLCDLDGDNRQERVRIIMDQQVSVWDQLEANVWKIRKKIHLKNAGFSNDCVDLDNDGKKEIVIWVSKRQKQERAYDKYFFSIIILNSDLEQLKEIQIPSEATSQGLAIIEDIDKDGKKEFIIATEDGKIYIINYAQGKETSRQIPVSFYATSNYRINWKWEIKEKDFSCLMGNKECKIKMKKVHDTPLDRVIVSSFLGGNPTYHYQIDVYSPEGKKIGSIISHSYEYLSVFGFADLDSDGNSEFIWDDPFQGSTWAQNLRVYKLNISKN